ncbi:MAG TPA: translation elongation factor Ts [Coriobacteriia bacterium]|nr:translation elongation factor Ts [Coriobacteriia bacterium]
MAEITAGMVKELRECTGAGMMECKKALSEAEGHLDTAIDILRTRGLASLAKKAGRAANEGAIAAFVSEDGKTGTLVEVNSETDFVGRNSEFLAFVNGIAEIVVKSAPADVDTLTTTEFIGRDGLTVQDVLGEAVSKLGENIGVARFERIEISGNGAVATYIHGGGKIGVIVEFGFGKAETGTADAFKTAAKDVAMQVAAAAPLFVSRDEAPVDVIEHELSIYKQQAAESGKPEAIQEKMAQGRLEKYYKEVVLPEQVFVKDQDQTVAQYVAAVAKSLGDEIAIVGFTRWTLGETAEA